MSDSPMTDVLGNLLELTQLRGRVYCQTTARAPWGLHLGPKDDAAFHLVTGGTCLLFVGKRQLRLVAGDLVLLARGAGHSLADDARSPRVDLADWLEAMARKGPAHARKLGGHGAEAQVLCGVYSFDTPGPRHPVLRLLPELLHLPANRIRACPELFDTVNALARETERAEMGSTVIVSRLLDVLFVRILRAWIDEQPPGHGGWVGALRDSLVGGALSRLHDDLAAPWEVETLASALGTSRATLARRFVAEVGVSPVVYLTQARMREAARLAVTTDRSLSSIAEAVGYTSEFAFNRAFRREYDVPPGEYRKRAALREPDRDQRRSG